MKITQIRNATVIVNYLGKKFLIDPVLAPKGTYPPFGNSPRQDQNNPLVELPISLEEILDVDAVVVTHTHLDHLDDVAKEIIDKYMKVFVQNESDYKEMQDCGFKNLEILDENTQFEGIKLIKTPGQHGRGEILNRAGHVSGVVFESKHEKTLYVAGDTVWYEGVENVLNRYKPEVILVNGGENQFYQGGPLIMGKEDIFEVHKNTPTSTIVVTHMEAINHWHLSKQELRDFAKQNDFNSCLLIPEDGETCDLD